MEPMEKSGAILARTTLREANLHKANLSRADFSGADLRGATLEGVLAKGANFRGADLREIPWLLIMALTVQTGADLTEAQWDKSEGAISGSVDGL